MACAERFSKTVDVDRFQPSQLTELLALPDAEETEKFIAEKAAEGKRVADMTIKQLREEIADYKNHLSKLFPNVTGKSQNFGGGFSCVSFKQSTTPQRRQLRRGLSCTAAPIPPLSCPAAVVEESWQGRILKNVLKS